MEKQITNLLNKAWQIAKYYNEIDRFSGAKFNVFKVIGLTSNEVRVHSRFLSEMLTPQGSHGQGDLFLKLFIEQLNLGEFSSSTANVIVEKYIGLKNGEGPDAKGGRIDILIDDTKGNTIVIENKIYASDQKDQLIRYKNEYPDGKLLYLTLDGKEATEGSAHHLVAGEDYDCVSYQEHILRWLERCQEKSVSKPLLREGIAHYIELIKYLTNQTSNKKMSTDIIKIIIQSPENIETASTLEQNFKGVKAEIQKKFWTSLINNLESNDLVISNRDEFTKELDNNVSKYYSTTNKYYYIKVSVAEIDGREIFWQCNIEDSIYVGFRMLPIGKDGGNYKNAEYETTRTKVLSLGYTSSEYSLGWKYTTPQLNFKAFNSSDIFNMADDVKLKDIIDAIASDAVSEIKELKKLLNSN